MDIFSVVGDCNDIKNIIENYSHTPSNEWFDNVEKIKYELKDIIRNPPNKNFIKLNEVQIRLNKYCQAERERYYDNTKNDLITCFEMKNFHKTITSKMRRLEYRYNGWACRADFNFIESLNIPRNKKFKLI